MEPTRTLTEVVPEEAICPVSVCQIPVDLVLRSSDKVLIGAHKANLETYSDGFPSADSVDDTREPVKRHGTSVGLSGIKAGITWHARNPFLHRLLLSSNPTPRPPPHKGLRTNSERMCDNTPRFPFAPSSTSTPISITNLVVTVALTPCAHPK
ncbi:hypothetical protein DFP72DRAFT_1076536 [Ephemerocybe angulata]|uniref:Uncharacterized protein n=1 Tax=Ephemerocybe angulata TaxID=980116 RepID=A0A8H6HIC3_9AGAR|nr:hypothetical protein DFP72DRAFT_1076536 [Tulosesus angulatus]